MLKVNTTTGGLTQQTDDGSVATRFRVTDAGDGAVVITTVATGQAVQTTSTSSGSSLTVATATTGNLAQRWLLQPFSCGVRVAELPRITTPNPAYVIEDRTYDAVGRVTSMTDGRGVTTTYTYNTRGQVVAQVEADVVGGVPSPDAARTEYAYDAVGNRTKVTLPRSFVRAADGTFTRNPTGEYAQVFGYTGRNVLASQSEVFTPTNGTSAVTKTINYTYTLSGKKASESDPRNATWLTTYHYGACCDRLESVTDPAGFVTRYGYDPVGNVTHVSDPLGNLTVTTYDHQHRPVTRTDSTGATTQWIYDDNLSDGVGLERTYSAACAGLGFAPGAAGSAVLTINPVGGTVLEIRDSVGRVVRRVVGGKS